MWQRPPSVPYPATWRHYVGRHTLANGQRPHFRIQDCPPELFDDVIVHMSTVFLRDELICDATNFTDDAESVEEFQMFWRKHLNQRMALVALVDDEDGNTQIAGVNITMVSCIEDQDKITEFKGVAMRKKRGGAEYVKKQGNIFNRYGVTEYLSTLGLSVAPEYRGQGLSLQLLLARIPLCKSVGIRLTCSIFTTKNSQGIARKAGFRVIFELPYNEYRVDGDLVFPDINGDAYQCMVLEIE